MYIHILKFFQNNQFIILMSYSEIKKCRPSSLSYKCCIKFISL